MNISVITMIAGAALALDAGAFQGGDNQILTDPAIEAHASKLAHVHAEVLHDGLASQLFGEVHKPQHGMGIIPGHVVIELIAADGQVLARVSNGYHHRSRRSRYSWFLIDLPEVDQPVATLRVMHRSRAGAHTPADA